MPQPETAPPAAASVPPAPQARQAASLLVGDSMTRWQALRAAGWWKGFDYAMLAIVLLAWITTFFWWVFGQPTANRVLGVCLGTVLLTQFWIIALVFRCSDFVLTVRADINLLPQAAARIVLGYMSGGGKTGK